MPPSAQRGRVSRARPKLSRLLAIVAGIAVFLSVPVVWAIGEMTFPLMHTAGKFEVDDAGTATYMIPIIVPSGTGGMQPSLSLVYNAHAGNSAVGMGWSLGGLSVITLCPATFARDNYYDPPQGDGRDRFCLDGQPLVAVSGQYGANGTEYRTERETFTKVVSHGKAGSEPSYFQAWTKSGLIMEFGNTASSRIDFMQRTTPRAWAVDRIQDSVGNYIALSYIEDNGGQFYPQRIDYTGNAGAGLSPYLSVQFTYESRSDMVDTFYFGSKLETDQRLKEVQTYVGSTLVRWSRCSFHGRQHAHSSCTCRDPGAGCRLRDQCRPVVGSHRRTVPRGDR